MADLGRVDIMGIAGSGMFLSGRAAIPLIVIRQCAVMRRVVAP